LLKARSVLNESIVEFSKIEHIKEQMISQVILASVELKLGNLDDALLAVYEADRLADEAQDPKFQRLLGILRTRVESQMASSTTRILDQFAAFGNLQASTRSRERLVSSLIPTLNIIVEKADALGGFIAIRNRTGKNTEVVSRERITKHQAEAILAWYLRREVPSSGSRGLVITEPSREPELASLQEKASESFGPMVFQALGFEGEDLGCLFIRLDGAAAHGSMGQESLHFIAAYASLISVSLYELVRNERHRPVQAPPSHGFSSIITDNKEMLRLLNLAERVAHSDATVLLQGETGTGKGLIAYAIHLLSERRDKRFIHVNCAALPETLLESELFGHARGSFTGAIAEKEGLLRQAHGGTIFLDEIGKTSLAMQGKLLQFLDTGKLRKVGSNEMISVDVQVICASKIDLLKLCEEGRFLEDFYYRINDFPLNIPPLRNRREDIPLLVHHYIEKISSKMGKIVDGFSPEALACLTAYHWPGNVRELEKIVKRAIILADEGEELSIKHIPKEIVNPVLNPQKGRPVNLKERLGEVERQEIIAALIRHGGNKTKAARDLGISYPNLLAKIKQYNIRKY
jgi:transcriptional regulator with GAF, ATPase, and Fis domain